MRPLPPGRLVALATVCLVLALPAAAGATAIAPVERVATGNGLTCPAGINATVVLFVADPCSNKLFTINVSAPPATAATPVVGTGADNTTEGAIPDPTSLAVNGLGVVYFTDNPPSTLVILNGRLRYFSWADDPNHTLVDSGLTAGTGAMVDLTGLSIDPFAPGNLVGFLAARYSSRIFNVSGTQVAGNGDQFSSTAMTAGGADPLSGGIGNPTDTAIDPASDSNVFFASHYAHVASLADRVWKVTNAGTTSSDAISVVAGGGTGPALGDGGSPTAAWLSNPTSIVALADGGLLIYDAGHARIRRVSGNGATIETVIGNGSAGTAADGTAADAAPLEAGGDMGLSGAGLFFSQPSGVIQMVPAVYVTSGPPATTNSKSAAFDFASWDSAASFSCKLDQGSAGLPCGPYSDLIEGPHSVTITAGTDAGTLSNQITRQWTVDLTKPAPFDLVSPGDGGGGLGVSPAFTWKPSADALSGLDRYELWIDKAKAGDLAAAACTDICTLTPPALGETAHTWQVKAFDKAGNETDSATRSFTVAVPPVAALVAAPQRVLVGHAVTLDASHSTDEGSGIRKYEFDLDGDGQFETDNGASPTLSHTYRAPATITVGVRVTDGAGLTNIATSTLTVTSTPPLGKQLGVSIDNGAQYTNDPHVTVFAVWPAFASDMLVSNDGGFQAPGSFPVAAQVPWTLDSSGPERLPKTIYVRFIGGLQVSETYQDDIILDQTPPKVLAAALTPAATGSGAAVAASARLVALHVSAKDNVSGVGAMQVTANKRKPGKFMKYRKTVKVKPARALFVRVRDRAGNLSHWRAAKKR